MCLEGQYVVQCAPSTLSLLQCLTALLPYTAFGKNSIGKEKRKSATATDPSIINYSNLTESSDSHTKMSQINALKLDWPQYTIQDCYVVGLMFSIASNKKKNIQNAIDSFM